MNLVLYLEVNGLGEDEFGNSCPAGLRFDFGVEATKTLSLDEMNINIGLKQELLRLSMLDELGFKPDDCRFISAEEYEAEYSEEAGNE